MTGRIAAALGLVALLAIVAVLAIYGARGQSSAALPSPTASTAVTPTRPAAVSLSPTATAASPTAETTTAPSPARTGAITGALGYPSNFIPPLTVYAIDVADQRIFFSVDTPCYGGDPNRSPPCASIAPQTRPSYTITSVTPGTYFVLAYRNDVNVGAGDSPGVYSRYVIDCIQRQETGSTAAPSCSSSDHSLVTVAVGAGETVRRVDVTDWYYGPPSARPSYPPRPR